MHELVRWILSAVAGQLRGRAAVKLENLALRHQLHVIRRRRLGRPRLYSIDRLLWVWLYRSWPRCLDAIVLVKPATVVQWHREGFRLFWRWHSRSGRPSADRETRALIRQTSRANRLWGAPRIHGELLKLGIEISHVTVAKYMVRRRGTPSPTWRSFLNTQTQGIAAIDMFVVASVSFRLLYVVIILINVGVAVPPDDEPIGRSYRVCSNGLTPTCRDVSGRSLTCKRLRKSRLPSVR